MKEKKSENQTLRKPSQITQELVWRQTGLKFSWDLRKNKVVMDQNCWDTVYKIKLKWWIKSQRPFIQNVTLFRQITRNSAVLSLLFVFFFSSWASITGVCANWGFAFLITDHSTPKCCFSSLALEAQRPPASPVLEPWPIHVSYADPVVVLIIKHTPLWMVTWRLPCTHNGRDVFDVVHLV